MAVHNHGNWRLPEFLVALSDGDTFPAVLREWELAYVEHLEKGEESETCLCTHQPIREVCHIQNLQNGNVAIVGNCCVKKFEGDTAFKGTHKIFDSLKRLRKDRNKNANEELIQYAYDRRILTKNEYDEYLGIWRNRTFTDRELKLIPRLNQRIIDRTSSKTVQNRKAQEAAARVAAQQAVAAERAAKALQPKVTAPPPAPKQLPRPMPITQQVAKAPAPKMADTPPAFARTPTTSAVQHVGRSLAALLDDLKKNSKQNADPRIIEAARAQNLLNDDQYTFYQKILRGEIAIPSLPQQQFRDKLNYKIIMNLKVSQDGTPSPNVSFAENISELTETPAKLANPRLIQAAYEQGIIDEKSNKFYLDIIGKRNTTLSESQRRWVNDLNTKMIKRLRVEEQRDDNRTVRRKLEIE